MILLLVTGKMSFTHVNQCLYVCGQIAVDQGFGGVDSQLKAAWLIDVVVDFFRDNGLEHNLFLVKLHFSSMYIFRISTLLILS